MTSDHVAGAWHQIRGSPKERWGKLTEDDLVQLEGNVEQLAGKLQERYGVARQEAERLMKEFQERMNWHRPDR